MISKHSNDNGGMNGGGIDGSSNTSDVFQYRRLRLIKRRPQQQQHRLRLGHNTIKNLWYPTTTSMPDGNATESSWHDDNAPDLSSSSSSSVASCEFASTSPRNVQSLLLPASYNQHRRSEDSVSKSIKALRRQQQQRCTLFQIFYLTVFILNLSFLIMVQHYYLTLFISIGGTNKFIQRELRTMLFSPSQLHDHHQLLTDLTYLDVNPSIEASSRSSSNTQEGITYFSLGRHDRSGAVVHDMLWVHAYAFSQNGTYGGACGRPSSKSATAPIIMSFQNVTQELIDQLHWNRALKYACPTNISNSTTEVIVEREFYSNLNASIFTPQWKEYFQQQISLETNSGVSPTDSVDTTLIALSSSNQTNEQIDSADDTFDANITKEGTEIASAISQIKPNKADVDENVYTIAVHIRRGDVDPCTYMNRYLSNAYYLRLIKKYYKQVPIQYTKINVNIYSESLSYESFDVFRNVYKYNLHLDDSLFNVWQALSTANVAILSKSSFSYVPAIINPNTVVYTSYRHLPLPSWDVVDTIVSNKEKHDVRILHETVCDTVSTK